MTNHSQHDEPWFSDCFAASFHMFSTHRENLRFLSDFQLIPWFSEPKNSPWFSHRFKGTPRPPGFPELLCGLRTHWSLGGGTWHPVDPKIFFFLNLGMISFMMISGVSWLYLVILHLMFHDSNYTSIFEHQWFCCDSRNMDFEKKYTPYLVTCWWNRHPLTLCTISGGHGLYAELLCSWQHRLRGQDRMVSLEKVLSTHHV